LAARTTTELGYSPEALVECAEVEVNLNFVVLKSNKRKSKSRVAVEPELKRYVKSGLRKSVARSTYLARSIRVTRTVNIRESRVSYKGKLSGVTEHTGKTSFLVSRHGELIPDVHPVTILTVNALTTNFNFYLLDKLMSRVV
jgi:hypothetical protein